MDQLVVPGRLRRRKGRGPGMVAKIFGPDGLIIIGAVIVVLLFGGAKLPKLARSLGSASTEFKKGLAAGDTEPALPPATSTDAAREKSSEHLDV
jgi:sec-independent protein translocase protein TatA